MDGFEVSPVEGLRSPVVVMAFTGWSDTGTVTIDAARHLIEASNAERFITVDPEEYFVFTETRPEVRLVEGGLREITWPTNEAWAARLSDASHDLVAITGTEPNLRWEPFASRFASAIAALQPSLVCTLVARPAATPHTRPIPVSGSAADAALARRFGFGPSRYQGPTGIIGVLHDAMRKHGLPLVSVAASVPHYLSVDENPPATLALLRALEPMVGYVPGLDELQRECSAFLQRVEEASSGDDQIVQYVRALEEQYQEGDAPIVEADTELSADDVLRDVEDLLRGDGS
ncbi:MAG: PAC2 family protein [Chloroflexota bacterium]|nr:PAC2 family protein [Chloroflexota bacterium]